MPLPTSLPSPRTAGPDTCLILCAQSAAARARHGSPGAVENKPKPRFIQLEPILTERPRESNHHITISGSTRRLCFDAMPQKRKADAALAENPTPVGAMPQKKFYRSRAHCNPLSHNDAFE